MNNDMFISRKKITQEQKLFLRTISHKALREKSKSFYFASLFLTKKLRNKIAVLYYFCRITDDIFDESDYDLNQKIDIWHILASWVDGVSISYIEEQDVLDKSLIMSMYGIEDLGIPKEYLKMLLMGYYDDMIFSRPTNFTNLLSYCVNVAGSVGCCVVSILDVKLNETLIKQAADLGIAFQLTNIARDILTDREELCRTYIPIDIDKGSDLENAKELCLRAEPYYESALCGLSKLPFYVGYPLRISLFVYRQIGIQLYYRKTYIKREVVTLFRKLLQLIPYFRHPNIAPNLTITTSTINLIHSSQNRFDKIVI